MGPSVAVKGANTSKVFETYTERFLVPALRSRRVVIVTATSTRTRAFGDQRLGRPSLFRAPRLPTIGQPVHEVLRERSALHRTVFLAIRSYADYILFPLLATLRSHRRKARDSLSARPLVAG